VVWACGTELPTLRWTRRAAMLCCARRPSGTWVRDAGSQRWATAATWGVAWQRALTLILPLNEDNKQPPQRPQSLAPLLTES
jgi:hypothetical protein